MSSIWHTFFLDPIYNVLVYFIDIIPGGDVGIAIILTVVLVKTVLLPLSLKATRNQLAMQEIDPLMKDIKEKYKDNKEEQAKKIMELFVTAKVNPLSSIFLVLIQIPILIALYFAVYRGGGVPFPQINTELLYSFVAVPSVANMLFLGFIDIAAKSLPLALLAGVTQYLHTHISMPKLKPRDPNAPVSFKDDLSRSMHVQFRYVMPLVIFFIAYTFSALIALYFTVSNLFALMQEYIVRKKGLKIVPKE